MFRHLQSKLDVFRKARKECGYIGRNNNECTKKAEAILRDPKAAYPELIETGESFLRETEGPVKRARECFSDKSYESELYSYRDGVQKHYSELMFGFDALENAFRARQKAELHFHKLRQKHIPFDDQLTARLVAVNANLRHQLQQAPDVLKTFVDLELFECLWGNSVEMLTERVKDMEQMLARLDTNQQ